MSKEAEKLTDLKAIVRRLLEEVYNKGNMDALDDLLAADFVDHMPGGPDINGIEAYKQQANMTRAAFPDICFIVEDQVAEGDKVATRWSFTGTNKGDMMGSPPTNKQVTVTGVGIGRISDGKIKEYWPSLDQLGMLQQVGIIPQIGPNDGS